ncbi:MAG: hypothetical protein Q7T81_06830 [Pseudolabrys sp.]|nr:hypothetical protein [Pseudolabrys sp.]
MIERATERATGKVAEDDYQSFSAALGASERGRAFLSEYAKRNRHADTEVVLAALDRLETVARSNKVAPEAERIRQDLRALLDTIHSARPQIDSTPGAIKAATLGALMEFVQARLEALVQPTHAPLASVPEPEQPELPMPQPGTAAQRTIALVQAIVPPPAPVAVPVQIAPEIIAPQIITAAPVEQTAPSSLGVGLFEPSRSTKIIPEVNFIDSLFDEIDAKKKAKTIEPAAPVIAQSIETPIAFAATLPQIAMPGPVAAPVVEPVIEPVAQPIALAGVAVFNEAVTAEQTYAEQAVAADPSQQAMNNALAAIMALSEEERLAMFT